MGNYTINGVKNCSKTKGNLRLLLVMIADAIPDNTGYYTLTTQALATYCNYGERMTRRLLTRLIQTGELIAIEKPGYKTIYMIPLLEGEPGYAPEACESSEHTCTRFHTPLERTRDELYRGFYRENRAAGRKAPRNDRTGVGGNDRTGVAEGGNDRTGGGGTIVPGRGERSYRLTQYLTQMF